GGPGGATRAGWDAGWGGGGGGGGGGQWIGSFGVAMVAVLWAYDGWIETTYVGSEIIDPGRNLPRSIILSTVIVIALYVLASLAYVFVLSPAGMLHSDIGRAHV